MTYLNQILADLREKRLWPVAAVLILALVAVPTLLAKSSSQTPIARLPQSPPRAAAPSTAVPAVSVETTSTSSNLKGHGRDPFIQQRLPAAASTAMTAKTSSIGSTGGSSVKATSGSNSAASTRSALSTPSAPLPRVLSYRYATSLQFGRVGGRLRTINDADRFTPLPSPRDPIAVYLGLRNDGKTAVFLLSSSASATGRGTCGPSRWSCSFLDLKVGQRELLLAQGQLGHVAEYELVLTRIHPVTTTAPSNAKAARAHVSTAGQRLVHSAAKIVPRLRTLTYSARTGLLSFAHRAAFALVHVGRLAEVSAPASRVLAGGGSQ